MRAERLAAWAVGLVVSCSAVAQRGEEPVRPAAPPDAARALVDTLGAAYLTDEERRDLRVFHGMWTAGDLATPTLRARAALTVGVYEEEWFAEGSIPAELRAEAALRRGDAREAIGLASGTTSIAGARILAEAHELLGEYEKAKEAVRPVVELLAGERVGDAAELTEGVRAIRVLARLEGRPGSDYERMIELLSAAHQRIDRLHWPALVEEARLLYDKDNRGQASEAALQALSLNPRAVGAWELLGRLAVDRFDFGVAETIAARLHENAGRLLDDPSALSPAGAMVTVRGALRREDPAQAVELMDRVLERYPLMREAHALRIAGVALRYDYEELEAELESFAEMSPGSPLALFEAGRALSEQRQYGHAARYLERARALQPNWADPVIELGLLEVQSGRDALALEALREATRLDPFNVRARNSLTLIEELLTYETIESDHFVIRYKPGVDRVMAEEMVPVLDEIHRVVATEFRHEPARKTILELMPDHEWFAVRIVGMPGVHTIAAATGPVIAMEAPKIGKRHKGVYDWPRVVRHEYVHTVTLSRTDNRIPHWFTEAAAVHMELAPRDYSTWQLLVGALESGSLFDLEQINIAFVRPEKPTDRSQAYAQGHWMYQFILETWGDTAPIELMDYYAEGTPEAEAFRIVLGLTQEAFLERFEAWAWEDAARVGMVAEPSVKELLLRATMEDEAARGRAVEGLGEVAALAGHRLAGGAWRGGDSVTLEPMTPEKVERFLEEYPDHPELLGAKIRARLGFDGATPSEDLIPVLERYARARPVDPMPHQHLARYYLGSGEAARAIPHLEFLDAREQRSGAFAVELARRYSEGGDLERAQAFAERATRIAPFDADYRETAAAVAIRARDFETAERHLRALTELEPEREQHRRRLEALRAMRAG